MKFALELDTHKKNEVIFEGHRYKRSGFYTRKSGKKMVLNCGTASPIKTQDKWRIFPILLL